MNRVVHFKIPSDDPETASEFYKKVFDWKFNLWDGPNPYWLIDTGCDGPGINGGMLRRKHPAQPVANTIDVNSVDEYVARIEAAGGQIVMPKFAVPGIGWLAYFTDIDGNIFGLMENDASAA